MLPHRRVNASCLQGQVVATPAKKILGIGAGPAEASAQIHVLIVYALEREVLAAEDGQPEWSLFDGEVVEEGVDRELEPE